MRDTRGKHVTEIFGEQHQRIVALEAALRDGVALLDRVYPTPGDFSYYARSWIASAREVLAAASFPLKDTPDETSADG